MSIVCKVIPGLKTKISMRKNRNGRNCITLLYYNLCYFKNFAIYL